jgi:hypothetical protein
MPLEDDLNNHLSQFLTAPILFVGSGLSRRYLNLENWADLLKRFCDHFGVSYQELRARSNSDLTLITQHLASSANELWWKDDKFLQNREKHSEQAIYVASALKIEIAQYVQRAIDFQTTDITLLEEIKALKETVVDGIITTNWDSFLESIFPDYKVFIGQDELLFSTPHHLAEIYKIHGCCTKPNSLVLTQEDYTQFKKKNPYLAAKLMTLFIEHPIIFLGYSLSDTDILEIIDAISACLTNDNINKLQDRLIFVSWNRDNEDGEMQSGVLRQGSTVIPIKQIETSSFVPIYKSLARVKRRFPAKLLRKLKEDVYDLVLYNDPKGKLYVQDIDESNSSNNLEVVFGVGAISRIQDTGYRGVNRYDLLRDIVFDNQNYDPLRLVKDILPSILKTATYVPIFKFLKNGGFLNDSGNMSSLDPRVVEAAQHDISFFRSNDHYAKKAHTIPAVAIGIAELEGVYGIEGVLHYGTHVSENIISLHELNRFLKENFDGIMDGESEKTYFIKLVCLFDYLKYKAEIPENRPIE